MSNLDLVKSYYQAFRDKDYDTFRSLSSPDLQWIQMPGFPGGATWHGADAVIDGVFKGNDGRWQGFAFDIAEYHDAGATIIVVGTYRGTNAITGRSFASPTAHMLEVIDGKVVRFRQFTDTKSICDALPTETKTVPPLARPATWDRVSAGYDAEVRPMFEAFSQTALMIANLKPGMRIADIAAGPGTLVAIAVKNGLQVDAIDFSPAMIERLQARITNNSWSGVQAVVGDGMALPFGDGQFDAAFSMFGLMFFTDRAQGLIEMHRILKPGATAVISSWVPMVKVPTFAATMSILSELFPELLPSKPLPPVLNDEESCRREFSDAGFTDIHVVEQSVTFEAASMEELVDSFTRTNAIVAHVAAQVGTQWPQAEQTLRERLAQAFGDGPQTMTMTALITSGRKAA